MVKIESLRRNLCSLGLVPSLLMAGLAQAQSGNSSSGSNPPANTQNTGATLPTNSRSGSGGSSQSSSGASRTSSQGSTGKYGHGAQTSTGQTPHSSSDAPKIEEAVIAGAAAVVITELIMHHDTPNKVAEHGPEVPKELDMSGFSIKGLARPGWPVVLDYVLNGPGGVEVTVAGDHHSTFSCIMTGRLSQRGFQIFNLPTGFGDESSSAQGTPAPIGYCPERVMTMGQPPSGKLQIANYRITAVNPRGSTGPPPQLRIFGLGAGEKAVGSVAIDQLTFQPPSIHPAAHEVADFGFHAHSDFDGVRAEFVFTTLNSSNGHILLQLDQEQKLDPIPEGERGRGTWNGNGKPGEHMLQVRAWRGFKNGGDWVVAWSPDIVDVVK
jgi:hypothetical protein